MNKKTIGIAATAALAVLSLGVLTAYFMNRGAGSHKDATYAIEGQSVTLKNGLAETAGPDGSASKIITTYFGNEARFDFDGDGREDVAFLLTQSRGGSGTFFYVVAALNTSKGYFGSQAVLLGDRIAPQSTNLDKGGIIVVNYADRAPGEAFTVQPSIGKSIWLLLDPQTMKLGEVGKNLEGTADTSKMTLGMKTWEWTSVIYNNDTEIKPRVEKKFTLTFKDKNVFSATTDCNNVGGEYSVNGNLLSFSRMFSTKMYCEGSQEGDFVKMLGEVHNYMITPKEILILGLKFDSGSALFK